MARARGYCFTLNNYSEAEETAIKDWKYQYLIFGHEKGESGTPHLQGYVYFESAKTLSALKKLQPRAHWAKAYGTPEQASVYCEKDGDFFEDGTRPLSNEEKGQKGEEYYERNILACINGTPMDPSAEFNLRNFEYAAEARKRKRKLESLADLSFEWHYGAPFAGKTRYCRQFTGAFKWNIDAGWNDYDDEDVVIFEDVDARSVPTPQQIKTWCDLDPFRVKILYKVKNIRPKRMIFTSNDSIETCYKHVGPVHMEAILRRFKVFHYPASYGQPGWVDPTAPIPPYVPDPPSPNRFTSLPYRLIDGNSEKKQAQARVRQAPCAFASQGRTQEEGDGDDD